MNRKKKKIKNYENIEFQKISKTKISEKTRVEHGG